MMTLEEIQASNVNLDVAREAYDQASKRLGDILDTKKVYEQKAFTLFNGFVTVSLALFGVGGALFKDHGLGHLVFAFLVAGLLFVFGAICLVVALIDVRYGALASDPEMWLNQGTIDGDDTALPLMLAYITYHHKERIDTSVAGNLRKARLIRAGIIFGVIAPFVLLGLLFAPIGDPLKALLQ